MSYPYSTVDRLQHPHAYMYSPYEGEAFLREYVADRLVRLRRLHRIAGQHSRYPLTHVLATLRESLGPAGSFPPADLRDLFASLSTTPYPPSDPDQGLAGFTDGIRVETSVLLDALILALLSGRNLDEATHWLDKLVQRFEVSKKLHQAYTQGVRKGEGRSDVVFLYHGFGIALSLAHAQGGDLQYLSTLLKLNDLLLSLPEETAERDVDRGSLLIGVAAELHVVGHLARTRGVDFHDA